MLCAEMVESYWSRQRAIAQIQAKAFALMLGAGSAVVDVPSGTDRVSPTEMLEMMGVDLGSQTG